MTGTEGGDHEGDTFAIKLRRLMLTKRHGDGRPYTPSEVAKDMTRQGRPVSKSYIYALLNGTSEPSHKLVEDFIAYFGVEAEYFNNSPRGRELARDYELLALLAKGQVLEIAYRTARLPAEDIKHVLEFVEFKESQLKPKEGQPDSEDPPPG
ncbi:helix-turn-helix domain-containing protein [Gandjariella thermophila]|uniref:helix-turn-helix domain-containing protein n=1 Tax=Gandjariella thermophila TaxID=1931992 RepID=UPI0010F570C6|nr:helix-turn-helix transcriptional regulator [Gandjariella thermophila]